MTDSPCRSLVRFIMRAVARIFFRIRITAIGAEHIPRTGGVVLAPNHVSYLDPPLMGCTVKRKVNFMAKQELFTNRMKKCCFHALGAFPVRRSRMDKAAITEALARLSRGEALVIFPEGTISIDGTLLPPKDGIGMIVARAGASVVPVFIHGSDQALPLGGRLRPAAVSVYFGTPVGFTEYCSRFAGRDLYRRISFEIMRHIHDLKEKAEGHD